MTNQTTGQHTPGPWLIQSHTMADKEFTVGPAIIDYDDVDHDEQEANAKLIASAPVMLETLQDFIDAATESSKNESYKANAYGFMMAVLPKARAALTAVTKK